jgi:hypothetical protein
LTAENVVRELKCRIETLEPNTEAFLNSLDLQATRVGVRARRNRRESLRPTTCGYWRSLYARGVAPAVIFFLLFQVVIAGGLSGLSGFIGGTVIEATCGKSQLSGVVKEPVGPEHTSHHEFCCSLHSETLIDPSPKFTFSHHVNFPAEATFPKFIILPPVASLEPGKEPQAPRAPPQLA